MSEKCVFMNDEKATFDRAEAPERIVGLLKRMGLYRRRG